MILQELYAYYQRLAEGGDDRVPVRYWSREHVAWEFEIDDEGRICSVLPLVQPPSGPKRKEIPFRDMVVPEHDARTSGIKPFFLCDKAAYFLGLDEKRGGEMLEKSRTLHRDVLDGCDDEGARAVLAFFDRPHEGEVSEEDLALLANGAFIVLRLKGNACGYVHDRPLVREAWRVHREGVQDGPIGQCLVTGEEAVLAELFPQVTGVSGGQSSGTALVSFNQKSFESYGKSKGENAQISEAAAFGAGAALKYLLKSDDHRVRIGDTEFVFWADRPAPVEEAVIRGAFRPMVQVSTDDASASSSEDAALAAKVGEALRDMKRGRMPEGLDAQVRFNIVGLAPSMARFSVRFFEVSSFGTLWDALALYREDTEIEGCRPQSIAGYFSQIAPPGSNAKPPATLLSAFMRAVLDGGPFPGGFYREILQRMRVDKGTNNTWDIGVRASILKACLIRTERVKSGYAESEKKGRLMAGLNKENGDVGYVLGRLFAMLEKAQRDANPGINSTIRDRYMASASTTPARVFPLLMRLSMHHIAKSDYGNNRYLEIQELSKLLEDRNSFPKTLTLDQQGQFYVGYYQQMNDLYKTRADKDKADSEPSDAASADAEPVADQTV